MVLATHAVVGGALAVVTGASPETAFVMGFASHFLLDAFPHWDYFNNLKSFKDKSSKIEVDFSNKLDSLKDFSLIGLDCLLGFILIFLFLPVFSLDLSIPVFFGALGGVLPDALQFVYSRFKIWPLAFLQRFHSFIHTDSRLKNFSKDFIPQVLIIILALVFINL